MRGAPAAAAILLLVLPLGACASARQSRPQEFSPPLTAGMTREYTKDFRTVVNAVQDAAAKRPHHLLSREEVDSSTVVFWTRDPPRSSLFAVEDENYPVSSAREKDDVRVVVQSLAPGRTVVRALSPVPEVTEIIADCLNRLFINIEVRLK